MELTSELEASAEVRSHLVIDASEFETEVTNLAYLPDGRLVAGYYGGTVGIWSLEGEKRASVQYGKSWAIVRGGLAVAADGTKIVCSDKRSGRVRVWNVDPQTLVEELTNISPASLVAISPDNRLVALGAAQLRLRHLEGDGEIKHSMKFRGTVSSMSFSPDGHKLAFTAAGNLYMYDIETSRRIFGPTRPSNDHSVSQVSWSRNGKLFSAWSELVPAWPTGIMGCINPDTGESTGQTWISHTRSGDIICLSPSPDGSKLASLSCDQLVRFWDVTSDKPTGVYLQAATAICFSPSGDFLALAGTDKKIYLWQVPCTPNSPCIQSVPPNSSCRLQIYQAFPSPGHPSLSPLVEQLSLRSIIDDEGLYNAPKIPNQPHGVNSSSSTATLESSPNSEALITVTSEQCQISRLSIDCPPPLDLTPYIVKISDRCAAGGGFGDVYRGWYYAGFVPKKVQVAVKAFRFKFTLVEDAENASHKKLRRELGIWRRLSHTNIVPFLGIAYGFGMHGAMSLVSLWMSNDTLQNFLEMHDDNRLVGVVHRLQILLDIANGLQYLHSFPIVHGDLNCNNVLLDEDYTARLADFGYASLVGNIPEALTYLRRSTTRPGALRWTAPEQISLEETYSQTTKSDIYSFGCVLSGKQPWSDVREDAAVVLRLVMGHKPRRPESRQVDDLHWHLIEQCWSSVQERPSADGIIEAIQWFLSYYPPPKLLRNIVATSDDSSLSVDSP